MVGDNDTDATLKCVQLMAAEVDRGNKQVVFLQHNGFAQAMRRKAAGDCTVDESRALAQLDAELGTLLHSLWSSGHSPGQGPLTRHGVRWGRLCC